MSIRFDLGKVLFFILFLALSCLTAMAGTIKGTVTDRQTGEPLTGATIQIVETNQGVIADIDGNYTLEVDNGTYTLLVRYIGYKDFQQANIKVSNEPLVLNIAMDSDMQALGEVSVVGRKNMESERVLQMERQKATLAIENLGAKEMTLKGISNVQEGVKKITGISIAEAGQLIVRGLGDRYSTTTLNGLPIASPNPDNKLIPLDLFPASTVRNITVSKVYEAGTFADYSGAHIDISTKESTGSNFFNIGVNVGGKFNTVLQDTYYMDQDKSMFTNPSIDPQALSLDRKEFNSYILEHNPFNTTFEVFKENSLPEFGGSAALGHHWEVGGQTLSLMASASISNEAETVKDAYVKTMEATGNTRSLFNYDSYSKELKIAGLGNLSYTLRQADHIGYTFFYARNAINTYMRREGYDDEGYDLLGSHSMTHIYTLQNHQANGHHEFGDHWLLDWSGSYSKTSSNEPDRRQVMFEKIGDHLEFFTLNQQETVRYFGSLDEDEWTGDVRSTYKYGENNLVRFGFTYKDKQRDYQSTRFYYDLRGLGETITNIYDVEDYLAYRNVADGTISITRDKQPRNNYTAGHTIYAGFAEAEYYPMEQFLVSLGLRYEHSKQFVNYFGYGGEELRRNLDSNDLFPALNLKYTLDPSNSLRFAFSRTITRPSFIEMTPFLYQESYGGTQLIGNADLKNGYNYNFDLRYELFEEKNPNNMFAVTGYAKVLQDPIERTQTVSGGAAMHSFQNADTGVAAGVEVELRRELFRNFRAGVNATYMYTNVKLPEDGGAYTNSQRSLQGASPYLLNADISYAPRFGEERQLNLSLLYNLQGPRIHAVGIQGMGDVKQEAVHTLDFVASFDLNSHFNLKLQIKDMLNRDIVFNQEMSDGNKVEVERFKSPAGFEIGFSYKL